MENKLTPEQAFEVIHKATGLVSCDRANHQLLEQALAVIKEAITPKPADEKPA